MCWQKQEENGALTDRNKGLRLPGFYISTIYGYGDTIEHQFEECRKLATDKKVFRLRRRGENEAGLRRQPEHREKILPCSLAPLQIRILGKCSRPQSAQVMSSSRNWKQSRVRKRNPRYEIPQDLCKQWRKRMKTRRCGF